MEPLKCETVTRIEVEYSDLERFINNVYNVGQYDLISDMEASNDTSYLYNVTGELDMYDKVKLKSFLNDENPPYILNILLNDLAQKCLIQKGKYLVNVCW